MDATTWLDDYARRMRRPERLEDLVRMADDRILAAVPELSADETFRHDLHASTRAHWRGLFAGLSREPFEPRPPAEAIDLARTIAGRGLDLAVLLASYRVGQRAVWQHITAYLDERIDDVALRSAVLVRFWDRTSLWLDTTVEALVGTYTREREQLQRGFLAIRLETVHDILDGVAVDVDAASNTLGYPLHHQHTAWVLWADDDLPAADVQRALEHTAAAVAAGIGAGGRLTVPSGARTLWCWSSTPGRAAAVIPDALSHARVHAATGTPAPGVAGFRRSHREALAAQTVAAAVPRPVTAYRDVELACLATGLGGSPAARELIRRELGPLAADDEPTVLLRGTLLRYLTLGGDARRAGERLSVHPNTVRYRVRRAEELLGRPVADRRAYIELALHILDAYGSVAAIPDRPG
ncbi:PucR family transcriptional regulator [Nocardia aurantia]|uniref:PucR family transcriptional regulator n=1 Tax=Nocardia aurantia TaxID=2585199 RepID=A0A7K0DJM4_9NOCA|nr:helix-turn-helix domain-containing protein [Nocardia aurantia]MQY26010.1 hypothetical protein [Nocardia aurantia]